MKQTTGYKWGKYDQNHIYPATHTKFFGREKIVFHITFRKYSDGLYVYYYRP